MKRKCKVISAFLLMNVLAVVWCSYFGTQQNAAAQSPDVAHQGDPDLFKGLEPKDWAQKLWTYIIIENFYREWKTFPRQQTFSSELEAPHGSSVSTYLTDQAYDALVAAGNQWQPVVMPVGSILVKENYPSSTPAYEDLLSLTVAYKWTGPTGEAQFYWVMYTPTPKTVTEEMKKQMLANCGKVIEPDPSLELQNPSGWQVHQINGSESFFTPDLKQYCGEVQSDQPKLCIDCHNNANDPIVVGNLTNFNTGRSSLGDYIWALRWFQKQASP